MKKIIRHTAGMKREIGAALLVALQVITLTLVGLIAPFASGPGQSTKAPSGLQTSPTDLASNPTATATAKDARRVSAIAATKLSGPEATGVFYLGASRAASANQSELP